MPCWYYDKKELRNTPSYRDGISPETEARYRREGARFIIDTGTKMGLRYDTCATGVVYFHRFYMFHSFREFHRYVMGACCLFLAGKVEETPKKCKDIVKTARTLLTDAQFMVFGDDPKEEVMTLERILLQTIKFDLQVEHPYADVLQFAKVLAGDKAKVQKMVQMAWTFINDSLCTTLCLQWESNIIAVALIYLASRLSKFDITDWEGKPPGFKGKWWEFYVSEVSLDLLEDVCHQVLDLYSATPQKKEESPPPPPPQPEPDTQGQPTAQTQKAVKRNSPAQQAVKHRETTASPAKADKVVKRVGSRSPSPKRARTKSGHIPPESQHAPEMQSKTKQTKEQIPTVVHTPYQQPVPASHADTGPPGGQPKNMSYSSSYQQYQGGDGYSQYNPYVSQHMYSSSFMSQEGVQSIQSLIGVGSQSSNANYTQQAPSQSNYSQQGNYSQPAQSYHQSSYQPPATAAQPSQTGYQPQGTAPPSAQQQYSMGYNQQQPYSTGTSYQQGYQGQPHQHQPHQPYAGQPSSTYPPYSQPAARPRHPLPAQTANGRGGPPPKAAGTPQPITRITSRR